MLKKNNDQNEYENDIDEKINKFRAVCGTINRNLKSQHTKRYKNCILQDQDDTSANV